MAIEKTEKRKMDYGPGILIFDRDTGAELGHITHDKKDKQKPFRVGLYYSNRTYRMASEESALKWIKQNFDYNLYDLFLDEDVDIDALGF